VRAVGEADGPRGPADLLHGDAVVHVAEPHPAVLLRRGEAVEVEVPHEPPQVHAIGEAVGGVDRRGVRRDGLLREPVHALLELVRAGGRAIKSFIRQARGAELQWRSLSDGARRGGRVPAPASRRRGGRTRRRAAPRRRRGPRGGGSPGATAASSGLVRSVAGSRAEQSVVHRPAAAWLYQGANATFSMGDDHSSLPACWDGKLGWGWGRRRAFQPDVLEPSRQAADR
jgi:hypothetical protein